MGLEKILIQQAEGEACYSLGSDWGAAVCWVVRKGSVREDKFGLDLEACLRSHAQEVWEEHSCLRGGQSEAWRWVHARCILGNNDWSRTTKKEKFFIDLIYIQLSTWQLTAYCFECRCVLSASRSCVQRPVFYFFGSQLVLGPQHLHLLMALPGKLCQVLTLLTRLLTSFEALNSTVIFVELPLFK